MSTRVTIAIHSAAAPATANSQTHIYHYLKVEILQKPFEMQTYFICMTKPHLEEIWAFFKELMCQISMSKALILKKTSSIKLIKYMLYLQEQLKINFVVKYWAVITLDKTMNNFPWIRIILNNSSLTNNVFISWFHDAWCYKL